MFLYLIKYNAHTNLDMEEPFFSSNMGSGIGCAVIFASKRNEAKRKRNFFRFDAKICDFFACFALMRNIEIWSETKMKQSENETKKKRNCRYFCFKAKWSETEAKLFSLQCEKSVWKLVVGKVTVIKLLRYVTSYFFK